jgi:hypothetical protein
MRTVAERAVDEYGSDSNHPLWHRGHWGFQYYMMERGSRPWDFQVRRGAVGDRVAIPDNNCNFVCDTPWKTRELKRFTATACPWLTTMHYAAGAGFYAESWGPLPFAFAVVPPEQCTIEEFTAPAPLKLKKKKPSS